jgi:hypothetical protein
MPSACNVKVTLFQQYASILWPLRLQKANNSGTMIRKLRGWGVGPAEISNCSLQVDKGLHQHRLLLWPAWVCHFAVILSSCPGLLPLDPEPALVLVTGGPVRTAHTNLLLLATLCGWQ